VVFPDFVLLFDIFHLFIDSACRLIVISVFVSGVKSRCTCLV
jgi:hypothetical protein